jgi:hypothetical protein
MIRKVAEQRAEPESDSSVTPVALGVAGGALGAMIGGNVGRTNGSSVAGAAVGAVAGVMIGETCSAQTSQTSHLAGYLLEHLGPTLTAYLSDAKEPVVDRWVRGVADPESVQAERLKHAWEAARYLVSAYGDATARSWFKGTNEILDFESPAWVLRHGKAAKDWEFVIPAAREAVENAR